MNSQVSLSRGRYSFSMARQTRYPLCGCSTLMSDLMITIPIAASLVIGPLAIVGYLLHRSETHDVARLLTRIKCVCGHAPLNWNGVVWLIDGHCHDSHDSVKYPQEERDSDTTIYGAGYVFDCPRCTRSLWFTYEGRLHHAKGREQGNTT